MKKLISSMAAIALTLTLFAFAPVDKNNDVTNDMIPSEEDFRAAGCNELNETISGFTRCYKISSIKELGLADGEVKALNSL
ncbi:hypothetical protein A8C32_03125 [Flavivirga aquatica]|uniref:Uncharacterized protein n=1 Tax=Flavivirga aquatica TaxID=1849968 RepID=A0A1E5TAT8_9FLAO|nr:hypothetical protein [Flavivirga aquatica]OEK08456.1 hypothetical protein A8C32_03125 [Flavivirga aquatica]